MHSIRFRLSVLYIVVVTLILAISGAYSQYQLSKELEQRFDQLRHGVVTRLQISLPSALWDLDEAKVNSIIEAEMLPVEVRGIRVFDSAVSLFAGKMRDEQGKIVTVKPQLKIDGLPYESNLYFRSNVERGNDDATQRALVGKAVVYFSREKIDATLTAELIRKLIEVVVVDCVLLFALILSLRLVFDPLARLRDALFDLARHDSDEVEELQEERRDEFGDVIRGFNSIQRKVKSVIERRRQAEEEARSAEEEARQATRKAESALEELKEAQESLLQSEKLASLGGLVAGVAHEINTPVGVTLTSASVLKQASEQIRAVMASGQIKKSEINAYIDTADESARLIMTNADRAAHLIQSFKQIAADQTSEIRRQFDLKQYIEEVITSLHPKIKHTHVTVHVLCEQRIEIDGYPGAFAQVITNLIINALTHAFPDEREGRINIHADLMTDWVEVRFEDDGVGIPQEFQARIFDPFFTTRRGQGGTGLGLNIVYNIITKQFGGTIHARSEVGKGTAFILRFPLTAPEGNSNSIGLPRV
ncbi:signal transduction histidine kinase [Chitinivorax tropicus]|uniref:histidine kinase n=1 Tax=Chitinivorax tropicus TaxID=714531 RepID=A0A840MQN1_9PROT|nr:HAMP domain-containing sensor histidine kinase [Chitinivorax tropicus]MBB5017551.1 signal transduction histidine kinase [Chitinivorax tropicus]